MVLKTGKITENRYSRIGGCLSFLEETGRQILFERDECCWQTKQLTSNEKPGRLSSFMLSCFGWHNDHNLRTSLSA